MQGASILSGAAIAASTSARSAARAALREPSRRTAIGAPITTSMSPLRTFQSPGGSTAWLPLMVTGTTGAPASTAAMNPPGLNGSSRPSKLRVPSGKNTTEIPAASSSRTLRSVATACVRLPRSTRI